MSGRNSEGNYSFSRDVLLFICTYKLFARSSQFEGENIHDDSIVVVVVVVVVRFFFLLLTLLLLLFFFFFFFFFFFYLSLQPKSRKTLHSSGKLRELESLST